MKAFDKEHILHPYAPSTPLADMAFVTSASGVYIELEGNKRVIDGMSSWWSVIHGYNVPS